MAAGDALRVRKALIDLTTQYQSQQVDAGVFQQETNTSKGRFLT